MRYLIYCDESDDKGLYCSNFYGGALIKLSDKAVVEARLTAAKGLGCSAKEFKWTKVCPYMEAEYIAFVREIFSLVRDGLLKIRIMFTQNINQPKGKTYDEENKFFILYYHFLKHAFGLRYCNTAYPEQAFVHVALDEVPATKEKFDNFTNYLSSLSDYPVLFEARVCIPKAAIYPVNSQQHVILQAVDVVLGAIQFRLNHKHKEKQPGMKRRAKRTRSKERVYNEIRRLIQEIYPNFNIGTSTGEIERTERWTHPYAHWLFVPQGSVKDLSKGKKKQGKR